MKRCIVLLLVAIVATALLAGHSAPHAKAHTVSNVRLVSQDTGKYLDANLNGTSMHLYQCLGQNWQNWDIIPWSGQWHQIVSRDSGKCLDVPGGQTGDVHLQEYTCNQTPAQLWAVPSGTHSFTAIQNQGSGKCVDVQWSAVGDGTIIWQYTCNQTRAQMWSLDNHDASQALGGVQEKLVWADRWYQFYEDSYSYTTWMTLTFHRHWNTALTGFWNPDVTSARDAWNTTPNTVYLSESSPNVYHDVHLWVSDGECEVDLPLGVEVCLTGNFGVAKSVDQGADQDDLCPEWNCYEEPGDTKPNTWWYVFILIDGNHPNFDQVGESYRRKDVVAHELGHAFGSPTRSTQGPAGNMYHRPLWTTTA